MDAKWGKQLRHMSVEMGQGGDDWRYEYCKLCGLVHVGNHWEVVSYVNPDHKPSKFKLIK